jgi:lipid-A-disaccharide synthase
MQCPTSAPDGVTGKNILIIVGEDSADRYGARIVHRIRVLLGDEAPNFFGTGGDEMDRAGVELLCHLRDLASIGPLEAVAHLPKYVATYRDILRRCRRTPPDMALLLDFPDFNLRLAKKLKREGIKIIYYISPQLWGWRRGRIQTVRESVDRMLVILPFEEEFYRSQGVDAEFVGHPLLEDFLLDRDRERFHKERGLDPGRATVALLPGSRRREVSYILPTLLRASLRVAEKLPSQFLISAAPTIEEDQIEGILTGIVHSSASSQFRIVRTDAAGLLANSDFGFVKSGTSTLVAALAGTPFLITYKISRSSWLLGRILIRTPYKGLVNLIAGEAIVPEFMQDEATPEALAQTALTYLTQPEKAGAMTARLAGIREKLGARHASESVADLVLEYM